MYKGRVIDVDVHHIWKSRDEIVKYLPAHWRDYLRGQDGRMLSLNPVNTDWPIPDGSLRPEAVPPDGTVPGSDYETTRIQLLEKLGIEKAILTFQLGYQSGMANPQLAAALCRACNQFNADTWLSRGDDRLRGLILVPTEVPDDAAKEIAHWSADPRMAGVLLLSNVLGKPFGHSVYDPIYRAAVENGLPVVIHVGGEKVSKGRVAAGGNPATMFERYQTISQSGMHYLTSMITSALFEKFPSLKVLFLEFGFTWLPSIAWRLDSSFKIIRAEQPLARRLPSEVIHEHVKLSTQPLDSVAGAALMDLLEPYEGIEDLLCFASDYPHFDAEEPAQISGAIPKGWQSKVFADNAASFFGFKALPARAASA